MTEYITIAILVFICIGLFFDVLRYLLSSSISRLNISVFTVAAFISHPIFLFPLIAWLVRIVVGNEFRLAHWITEPFTQFGWLLPFFWIPTLRIIHYLESKKKPLALSGRTMVVLLVWFLTSLFESFTFYSISNAIPNRVIRRVESPSGDRKFVVARGIWMDVHLSYYEESKSDFPLFIRKIGISGYDPPDYKGSPRVFWINENIAIVCIGNRVLYSYDFSNDRPMNESEADLRSECSKRFQAD